MSGELPSIDGRAVRFAGNQLRHREVSNGRNKSAWEGLGLKGVPNYQKTALAS